MLEPNARNFKGHPQLEESEDIKPILPTVGKGTMKPSTVDSGFILSLPPLQNPYTSDSGYKRVLRAYLPPGILQAVEPQLTKFASEAISDEVYEWISNAEREQPYVKTRNVWGAQYPFDRLVTSNGWKQLGKWGSRNGYACLHKYLIPEANHQH